MSSPDAADAPRPGTALARGVLVLASGSLFSLGTWSLVTSRALPTTVLVELAAGAFGLVVAGATWRSVDTPASPVPEGALAYPAVALEPHRPGPPTMPSPRPGGTPSLPRWADPLVLPRASPASASSVAAPVAWDRSSGASFAAVTPSSEPDDRGPVPPSRRRPSSPSPAIAPVRDPSDIMEELDRIEAALHDFVPLETLEAGPSGAPPGPRE